MLQMVCKTEDVTTKVNHLSLFKQQQTLSKSTKLQSIYCYENMLTYSGGHKNYISTIEKLGRFFINNQFNIQTEENDAHAAIQKTSIREYNRHQ